MNNTAHTPGPWRVIEDLGEMAVTPVSDQANGGYFIAHCAGPDARGNAPLIAVAPELLQALQNCQAMLEDWASLYNTPSSKAVREQINANEALIKKAKGEDTE
jgi:hypothetical protein